MFSIEFKKVLTMLVEHELPKTQPIFNNGEITRDGISLDFILEAYDYRGKRRKEVKERFYMLFCGNVSVFYVKIDLTENWIHSPIDIPIKNWVNSSNHDSCWNSDGFCFISEVYFKMCKKISPDLAPKFVDTNARFTSFSYPVKKCKIIYRRKDDNNYENEIIKVIIEE